MFDIGWSEMAIVAVVALFVIGPKDLPKALRTVGRYAGKIRGMAREFQASIDDAVRDTELEEVKKQIESVGRVNINKAITDAVDPTGEIDKSMDFTGIDGPPKTMYAQPDSTKIDDGEAADTVTKDGGEDPAAVQTDDPPALTDPIPKKTGADA